MPVVLVDRISPEDCLRYPAWRFLFGDNALRKGRGGQAEIRGMPNAHGIRTKLYPSTGSPTFYMSDEEFVENCEMIDEDLRPVFFWLSQNKTVVRPRRIGHGLAELDIRAPLTFAYLTVRLESLSTFFNVMDGYVEL